MDKMLDVPHPTDFPPDSDAPGLRHLDHALRCTVCQELYDAPVLLPCGHTFCSICARDYFQACSDNKTECPQCRAPATAQKLIQNVVVEEIVSNWKLARGTVLRVIRESEENRRQQQYGSSADASPVRGTKKRKRELNGTTGAAKSSSTEREYLADATESGAGPSSPRKRSNDVELASCPICHQRMVHEVVFEHLEADCKIIPDPSVRKKKVTEGWKAVFTAGDAPNGVKVKTKGSEGADSGATKDRLPSVSYDVFKDTKIRQKLKELNLPTTGDRATIIARHKKYTLLFNANLDRGEHLQKTEDVLREELRQWEKAMGGPKAEVADVKAYARAHKTQFQNLIEEAKGRSRKLDPPATANIPLPSTNMDRRLSPAVNRGKTPLNTARRRVLLDSEVIDLDSDEES